MDTEGRWLTYGELGAIRGTKRASAIKLAQRERWPKQAGNDRSQTVRVLVPGEWLVSAKDQPAEAQDAAGGMSRGFANLLAEANKRADAALTVANTVLAQLADATARVDRAELVSAELRAQLEAAHRALQEAAQALDALRRENEARQARGLVARVRAALLGGS